MRFLAALLLAVSAAALAQAPASEFKPSLGQQGKDVIWVPTPQVVVDRMLDMANVTKDDVLYDLGSGDGRTVITAARRGARALGIEYNPDMVAYSQKNAEAAGVAGRATFRKADLFETDFSEATVITMFLLPSINLKLRPKLLALRPGTRIVSNTFTMDEWSPEEVADLSANCESIYCTALLWIVPAQVAGAHKVADGSEVVLSQRFQMLTGMITYPGGNTRPVTGRVRGTEVLINDGTRDYRGTANGKELVLR